MGDSNLKFAIGFILGMATGLVVALLVAPMSGGDARETLKEKTADVRGKVRDIADDVGGKVKEVAGDRKKIYKKTWKQPRVKPYAQEL